MQNFKRQKEYRNLKSLKLYRTACYGGTTRIAISCVTVGSYRYLSLRSKNAVCRKPYGYTKTIRNRQAKHSGRTASNSTYLDLISIVPLDGIDGDRDVRHWGDVSVMRLHPTTVKWTISVSLLNTSASFWCRSGFASYFLYWYRSRFGSGSYGG